MKYASRNSKIRTTLSFLLFLLFSLFERANIIAEELSRAFYYSDKSCQDEGREDGILRGWEMGLGRSNPSRGSFARLNNGNPGIFSYDRRSDEWWSRDEFYGERSRVPLETPKWIFLHRYFNRHFWNCKHIRRVELSDAGIRLRKWMRGRGDELIFPLCRDRSRARLLLTKLRVIIN